MFSVRSTKRKGLVPVAGRGTSSDGPWQKQIPRISLEDEETVARKTKQSRSLNSPGGRKEVVEDKAGQPEKKRQFMSGLCARGLHAVDNGQEWQRKQLRVSIQMVRTGWLCGEDSRDTGAGREGHRAAIAAFGGRNGSRRDGGGCKAQNEVVSTRDGIGGM